MKMFSAVFIYVMLFSGGSTSSLTPEIVIESESSRWASARDKCKARGPTCDLSTHRIQANIDAWSSVNLPVGSTTWVGARVLEQLVWQRSQRPLIEELGCYQMSEDVKADMRTLRRFNGPERCLSLCTTNIVAIQGTACYCVSPDKMASLQQRSLEGCYQYCNREPGRCGGDDSRISVYKIPDRTLYEKRGKANKFFWQRSSNNEQEFLIFTNRPGRQKQEFCAAQDGTYSTTSLKAPCPEGGQAMSFEDVDVMQFLSNISSRSDLDPISFSLPLEYSRPFLWLDGGVARISRGRGPCVAITYDGQQYSLVKKACRVKLPSACSCYTPSQSTTETTTEPTTTTTTTTTPTPETTTTSTTTTTLPTSTTTTTPTTTTTTTTSTPETSTTTTTTEPTSTTTTTEPTSTTDTTTTTTTPEPETSTITETTSTLTNAPGKTMTTMMAERTETYAPWKTMTNEAQSSVTTYRADSASTFAPEGNSSAEVADDKTDVQPEERNNNQLLFPFADMKESDDSSRRAPSSVPHGESTSDDDKPASATGSIELIVGVSVAAVALMLIIIIVVIGVKRRKQKSSTSLLKGKTSGAAERGTSYPI